MFQDGDFSSSINRITLRFKDSEIEEQYCATRIKHLDCMNAGKLMIIATTFVLCGFFSYTIYMYEQLENVEAMNGIILATCVLMSAWIVEFFFHYFRFFHFLGGFPFIIMISWMEIQVPSITMPTFGIVPGGISFFLLMLFVGMFYSKNWMMATLAQTCGYTIISVLAWQNYYLKMDKIKLMTLIININVGLFVSAFIYYYFESQQRMTAFANWKTDKVKYYIICF